MPILIAVLSFFLLLFLLLLVPVQVQLGFREEFTLVIRYLFFTIRPLEGAGEEEETQEAPEETKKSGEGMWRRLRGILKNKQLPGFLEALYELGKGLKTSGIRLFHRIRCKEFDLYLCVGASEDAAETALFYGKVSGAVYGVCGLLFGMMKGKKKRVTVDLDYQRPAHLVDFTCRLSVRPLVLLREGVSLLRSGFPLLKKWKALTRKEQPPAKQPVQQ